MGKLFLISGNEEFSVKERAGTFIHELFGDAPEDNTELEIIRGDDDRLRAQTRTRASISNSKSPLRTSLPSANAMRSR